MFKKVLVTMLSAMVVLGGMTVNCYAESDGAITVNTAYGEVKVPSAPTRVCVLDLSVMDILDTLGLGDNVVVLQWHKHYPSYLEEYYNSETIISLTSSNSGHGGAAETVDEDADPYEMYYSIDADIIIGTTEKIDENLYAILSQIAPTVVLTPALESSENLYDAVCENAETIASIWGVEGEYESYVSKYDEIYAQLSEAVDGKTYVMANGNTELGLIQIGSAGSYYNSVSTTENTGKGEASEVTEKSGKNESSETAEKSEKSEASETKDNASSNNASGKSGKKNNTANADTFLSQLGMTNVSENVSEDAAAETIAAAVEAGTSNEDAAAMSITAINEAAPDGVFVFNYCYSSLDEIREDGFDLAGLDDLICPAGFISIELTYTSGGLHAVTSMLDVMAEMFLD